MKATLSDKQISDATIAERRYLREKDGTLE
jgi:hypothetical protein